MTVVSTLTSREHLNKLRAEHQARAVLTAASGVVPEAFHGDPTFRELVSVKRSAPAPRTGLGLLAAKKSHDDKSANNSG